jgi:hypothetical protein
VRKSEPLLLCFDKNTPNHEDLFVVLTLKQDASQEHPSVLLLVLIATAGQLGFNQGIRASDVIYSIQWIFLYILHTISILRL